MRGAPVVELIINYSILLIKYTTMLAALTKLIDKEIIAFV